MTPERTLPWMLADAHLAWFLVPLFLLWLLLWLAPWQRPGTAGEGAAVRYSSLALLRRIPRSNTLWLRRLVRTLRVVVVALLLVAMARPQTGRVQTQVRSEGIDIVLVLDTSGSMRALDLDADRPIPRRRNRLEVAKAVVERFVEGRLSDQIGLVVFGSRAFTQCPLTLDHAVLATLMEDVEVGIAGEETAIGSAVGTAVKRLRDSEAKSKVVILLTDGRNTRGVLSPVKAAEVAEALGIRIYTIGAGTRGKAPFQTPGRFGGRTVYRDVEIDEETLKEMAEITGGAYYRAEDREALEEIYRRIDQLEKTEITMDTYTEYDERFAWLVAPALLLLLVEVVLLSTRLQKTP